MPKVKISGYKLKHITMQGEDFIIDVGGTLYSPLYSAALVPSMGNRVIYQGAEIAKLSIGIVISLVGDVCRVQRMPELNQVKDFHAENVHKSDIVAFLIGKPLHKRTEK